MSIPLKIRIDTPYLNISIDEMVNTLLSFTDDRKTAVIVREHNPDDHVHVYLKSPLSIPTLRTRIRPLLTEGGNKAYSIGTKHHDWDIYIGYMFKYDDTTEVLYVHETLDQKYFQDKYNNYAKEEKKYEESDKIIRYVEAKDCKEPRDIAKAVCDYYVRNNKPFHKINMAMLVNMIWYKMGNQDCFINNLLRETGIEGEVEYDKDYKIEKQSREISELKSKNTSLIIANNSLRERIE